jgi:hypothetical protein
MVDPPTSEVGATLAVLPKSGNVVSKAIILNIINQSFREQLGALKTPGCKECVWELCVIRFAVYCYSLVVLPFHLRLNLRSDLFL